MIDVCNDKYNSDKYASSKCQESKESMIIDRFFVQESIPAFLAEIYQGKMYVIASLMQLKNPSGINPNPGVIGVIPEHEGKEL